MTPDFTTAATKAAETLIQYGINSAPVDPLPILKKIPGVLVITYEQISNIVSVERRNIVTMCGVGNQDAVTSVREIDGKLRYVVAYNQKLPFYVLQRALAREMGHIILGHDGSRPESVRYDEAMCFAHHLICPRPLIYMIKATGLRLTKELLNNVTGCNDSCLFCMRRVPAVEVPAELNKKVSEQFKPWFMNFFEYEQHVTLHDGSALADFGTYMDGYKE